MVLVDECRRAIEEIRDTNGILASELFAPYLPVQVRLSNVVAKIRNGAPYLEIDALESTSTRKCKRNPRIGSIFAHGVEDVVVPTKRQEPGRTLSMKIDSFDLSNLLRRGLGMSREEWIDHPIPDDQEAVGVRAILTENSRLRSDVLQIVIKEIVRDPQRRWRGRTSRDVDG